MSIELVKSLQSAGVKFLRVTFCDNANVIRAKAIHLGILEENLEYPVGITAAQQALPVMCDEVVNKSGLGPVGEIWLVPDWSTVKVLPYAPTHARVMGDMVEDQKPWSLCPRYFLKRAIAAGKQAGIEVMAAFENEFSLLHGVKNEIIPSDHTVFAATLGMDLNRKIIDAIADALVAQDITVERYYPESGPGQHEISIRYTSAMQAADRQIAFRETVRAVAIELGFKASFLPKIFANCAGNGCHLHLSLWQEGKNIIGDGAGKLSPTALAFIGGILHHLPGLMALTTPSTNSYRRIRPHCWSGAFKAWGYDNREGAVRVPSNPVAPTPTHFELKTSDASANPYLALGAVIFAGLDGVRNNLDPGQPVEIDPGNFSQVELADRGISPLPQNLGEAIEHLSRDRLLLDALGIELSRAYLAVRKAEWNAMKEMELDEEVNLLLERY
ncbi:MAG: glutamine synthetase family protein [Prochloraceae cyanobacterium]|nr:glutamine synthetase family protein [Prochloraceae cyanobacterium]